MAFPQQNTIVYLQNGVFTRQKGLYCEHFCRITKQSNFFSSHPDPEKNKILLDCFNNKLAETGVKLIKRCELVENLKCDFKFFCVNQKIALQIFVKLRTNSAPGTKARIRILKKWVSLYRRIETK